MVVIVKKNENCCWCEDCEEKIEKGSKFLLVTKNARKGSTRVNICRKCLIRFFINFDISEEEINKIKKEEMLKNLEN